MSYQYQRELSVLSYKELQALARKHQVPCNLKKHLLIEILYAVKSKNCSEVTQILADIKKNRRNRVKKIKAVETQNMLALDVVTASSGIINQDSLLPMERIEEKMFENTGCETVQLGLDLKSEATFPHHNYIDKSTINQQKLMDKYGTDVACHGFILSTSIAVISPNHTKVQTSATHGVSSVESTVSCTTQKNHMLQQINEQPTVSDIHHSLLLKRMLQAPVGVSLSHMANHPIELGSSHSTTSTKTASERDEQEVLQAIAESSGVGNAGFNIDLLLQEKPAYNFKMNNTLQTEETFQLDSIPSRDPQENCYQWLGTSVMNKSSELFEYNPSSFNSKAIMPYFSIDNQNPNNSCHTTASLDQMAFNSSRCLIDQSNYQTYINTEDELNMINQQVDLEESDLIPDLQLKTLCYSYSPEIAEVPVTASSLYHSSTCLQDIQIFSLTKNRETHIDSRSSTCYVQTKTFTNAPICNSAVNNNEFKFYQEQQKQLQTSSYIASPFCIVDHKQAEVTQSEVIYYPHQRQDSPAVKFPNETQVNEQSRGWTTSHDSSIFTSYWPCWSPAYRSAQNLYTGGRLLENILNLSTPNYVDYTKMNETCCVYINKAPVMTLRCHVNSSMMSSYTNANKHSGELSENSNNKLFLPECYNYYSSNWLAFGGGSVETTTITDKEMFQPIL